MEFVIDSMKLIDQIVEIFNYSSFTTHKKLNLPVYTRTTSKYENKNVRILGTHIPANMRQNMNILSSAKIDSMVSLEIKTPFVCLLYVILYEIRS